MNWIAGKVRRVAAVRGFAPWALGVWAAIGGTTVFGALVVPPGFDVTVLARGFDKPVSLEFAPDGRLFVVQKGGLVRVVTADGDVLPTPFIDLSGEIDTYGDRGLIDIAFHPSFITTPWVYLTYVAPPPPGAEPSGNAFPTHGRLVRVLADVEAGGNVADLDSMEVLIGDDPDEGVIQCYSSHTVGTIRFANDGSLFVAVGDGAHFELADAGGHDPGCFAPPLFDPYHDIGAFRAQDLDSPAGKILRVDPESGDGLPSNPYWTGDEEDVRSKVWAYGLRNPFQFVFAPDAQSPERLWIADVGWRDYEELNVCDGGENFGWPCYEGFGAAPEYPLTKPAHSGCETLETAGNPGPLTAPAVSFHHSDGGLSDPPGVRCRCILAAGFYGGELYPPRYRGKLFIGAHVYSWINVVDTNALGSPGPSGESAVEAFATGAGRPVGFTTHPDTGDIYYIPYLQDRIHHIEWVSPSQDADFDGDVDLIDFGRFQACFADGVEDGCAGFNDDGDQDVDLPDYDAFQDAVGQY